MLGCANRNDYIDDDDEVLEQFDLDKLNGRFSRSVEYGENILDDCDKLSDIFEEARKESDFGNGRYVRNVIEKAKMAQATRLLAMDFDSIGSKDITTICAEDIEQPVIAAKTEKKRIGFCV